MFTKSSPRSSSRSAFQSSSKEKIERGWIRRSTSCRVCGNSYKLIVEGLRIRVLEKERPRMLSPVVSVCWGLRRKTAGSILNNNLLTTSFGDSLVSVILKQELTTGKRTVTEKSGWLWMVRKYTQLTVWYEFARRLRVTLRRAKRKQPAYRGSSGALVELLFGANISELLCGGWILRGRWLAMFILIFYFMMLFMLLLFMVNC